MSTSITTLSISMKCPYAEYVIYCYAEYLIFIVTPNANILNVVILNVIMLSVAAPQRRQLKVALKP